MQVRVDCNAQYMLVYMLVYNAQYTKGGHKAMQVRVDWSGSRGSGHAQSSQTRILQLTAIKVIIISIIINIIIHN